MTNNLRPLAKRLLSDFKGGYVHSISGLFEVVEHYLALTDQPQHDPRDAVVTAAMAFVDDAPIGDDDEPYLSEISFAEFRALLGAVRQYRKTLAALDGDPSGNP